MARKGIVCNGCLKSYLTFRYQRRPTILLQMATSPPGLKFQSCVPNLYEEKRAKDATAVAAAPGIGGGGGGGEGGSSV